MRCTVGVFGMSILVLQVCWAAPPVPSTAGAMDLSRAYILVPGGGPVLAKAAEMLRDEVEKRSSLRPAIANKAVSNPSPAIVIGTAATLTGSVAPPARITAPDTPDGYTICIDGGTLYLIGHDERGALFAVGRLIREAHLAKGVFEVAADLKAATAPVYGMRGHQLGYRNTANSYDAWDLDTFEQYIRDCIIFGANAVELIPSLREDYVNGPVMQTTQRAMNVALARLLHSYGLDVWLFLALGGNVQRPEEYQWELTARDALFAAYPAVDHVMVPGGDPGHTPPDILMPWLADMSKVLRRHFPNAGLWVSNQGFTDEQNDVFFRYLQEQQPDWLTGVVFGPWTKISLKEERERTPSRYAIRRYPDITHNVRCQYPVPEWDGVFAQTIGRECANPRPAGTAHIHNLFAPLADGFVSYSDGCHDDLNKMIWTALEWDPEADVAGIVREYAKVFFGEAYADSVAEGLWMLEANWRGSAAQNETIDKTLDHWLAIEARAGEDLAGNWRFQLHLLRAMCDAYLRARAIAEGEQEQQMYAALKGLRTEGGRRSARGGFFGGDGAPRVRRDLRLRIEELSLAMLKSIGMQFSIFEPYRASNTERGAILDGIDRPVNNRIWLAKQIEVIRGMENDQERAARIEMILNWESPKPGALYDDLGCAWKQPHLVRQTTWDTDPGFVHGPQEEHAVGLDKESRTPTDDRMSWLDQAQTLFGAPLKMRYENLDPVRSYTIRITYAGRYKATMRLIADGRYEVHGPLPQPDPVWPVDFPVPREATRDGILDLEWQLVDGRGCQVAEVWLIPE